MVIFTEILLLCDKKLGLDTPLFTPYSLETVEKIYQIWRYSTTLEKPVY